MPAKQAITEVLYQYCRAVDRLDAELGYGVWHPDGTAHYGGIYQGSGRGFIDLALAYHRTLIATSHQVTNVLIEVSPDLTRAASETYLSVRLRMENDGEFSDLVGVGRYLDAWSCRNGTWAIDHRQCLGDISSQVAVPAEDAESAVTFAAEVPAIASRRDAEDPSYALFAEISRPG